MGGMKERSDGQARAPVSRVQTTSSFPKQCRCVFLLYTSPLVNLFPQKTGRLCCFVVVPFVFMNQPRAKGKGHRLDTNAVFVLSWGGWLDSGLIPVSGSGDMLHVVCGGDGGRPSPVSPL